MVANRVRVGPLALLVQAADDGIGGEIALERVCRACPAEGVCAMCEGSGVVLTAEGAKLIAVLLRHLGAHQDVIAEQVQRLEAERMHPLSIVRASQK